MSEEKRKPPQEGRLSGLNSTPLGHADGISVDDDKVPKLYIILNGQFGFKSLNKKMQPSALKQTAR